MREAAQYLNDLTCALSTSDDDDDIDSGVLR
jgi:hypothetical protein